MEKVPSMSKDVEQSEKDKLKSVFPQCFVEGKLDIDKLLSICGEYIDNDFEKYKFEWSGKSECYKIIMVGIEEGNALPEAGSIREIIRGKEPCKLPERKYLKSTVFPVKRGHRAEQEVFGR